MPLLVTFSRTTVFISLLFSSIAVLAQQTDLTLLQAFAESGDAKSQYQLGRVYQHEGNATETFKWIKKAAEQGYAAAQFDLGTFYDIGEGVKKDQVVAANWYRKAAENGEIAAQYNLAVMFEQGEGVDKNLQQAYIWYSVSEVYGYKGAKTALNNLIRQLDPDSIGKADKAVVTIVNRINQKKSESTQ